MTVRTRFAPSPTGYLHLGGLRTALYTYLYAKKNGGKFILRIEDTDQEREVPGAVEKIYNSMALAGLHYDEGPDVGGDYGPYIQSQRKDTYLPFAMQLVESGAAYPCFCSKEELDERRAAATAEGGQWKYDKHCLSIPKEEALRRMQSGEPFVIRQNIPTTGTASFEDALYGHVEAPCDTLDDNVLIKQDGLPTYNFANVIDDHLMGITHVMRGTEYLSSTPKYNLLYEALGWTPPTYIHMSPVMKDASRKLSKRHGDPGFEDLLAQGYVKDAIINFIALLGWCPDVKKYGEKEFFTMDELIEAFDLSGLSKSPAIFNTEKLNWFNHEYIMKMDFEDYLAMATPWFDQVLAGKNIDYRMLASLMHTRTEVFSQVPEQIRFLAELPEYNVGIYTHKKMKTDMPVSLKALQLARPALAALADFSEENVKEVLMNLAKDNGLKTGQIMWPVRIAISGLASTPGGATEIAYLLGKEESLRRIDFGIRKLERCIATAAMESKWQKYWEENKTFATDVWDFSKPKYYVLDMFPYPSGVGLHAGHPEGYTATDIMSRMKRMQGYNVLHPMGYDSFGLPAEQYAVDTGNHPNGFTQKNIETFSAQLKELGFDYDWDKVIATTDPEFYKWTQWIFKKLYEAGYAKRIEMPVNWCEALGTVLANDEVIDGKSERGGYPVEKRMMMQWVIDQPAFAEKLLEGLDEIDWPESTKEIQRNWIGKSTGVEVDFKLVGGGEFSIYTTCIETIYGITFMVLAPDGKIVKSLMDRIENREEVEAYIKAAASKSEIDRTDATKTKTGCPLKGIYAINPVNGKEVPVFIGDFVLGNYGTGAVMAVPSHDQRDFEYAIAHNIPMLQVIEGRDVSECAFEKQDYLGKGCKLMNSEEFTGLTVEEAKEAITTKLEGMGVARRKVNYHFREWIFARQRYWGEPVPCVYTEEGDTYFLPDEELPLILPELQDYKGRGGKAPLENAEKWKKYNKNGVKGLRETSTMPGSAGSSWYYLRYIDPKNDKAFCDPELLKHWMPVDLYVGGPEHAVGHLIYSRIWNRFLYDQGLTPVKEPFKKLVHQGMILGENGIKMGKRFPKYVVNPSDIVREYGADTLRLYEMFMGPLEVSKPWSSTAVAGARKFIDRVWNFFTVPANLTDTDDGKLTKIYHQTVRKVTSDFESLGFNTAIAQMMTFVNEVYKNGSCPKEYAEGFIKMLSCITPHVGEEIWQLMGHDKTIAYEPWPTYSEEKCKDTEVEIAVQINGKVRSRIMISPDLTREEAEKTLPEREEVKQLLAGKNIVKVIFVPGRLCNFIVK